jgi:hypothetical protein
MNSTRAAAALLSLGLFLVSLPAQAQEPAFVEPTKAQYQLFEDGQVAYMDGEYLRAVDLFKASLLVGDLNITNLNLGRAYFKLGRCKEARGAYAKVRKAPRVRSPKPQDVMIRLNEYLVDLDEKCVEGALNTGPSKCPEGTSFEAGSGCVATAASATPRPGTMRAFVDPKITNVKARAGWAMLGLGVLGMATGGLFVGLQLNNNEDISDLERSRLQAGQSSQMQGLVDRGRSLEVGIWTGLGLGAALSTLGVVWLLDDGEASEASTWRLRPVISGDAAGVSVEVWR